MAKFEFRTKEQLQEYSEKLKNSKVADKDNVRVADKAELPPKKEDPAIRKDWIKLQNQLNMEYYRELESAKVGSKEGAGVATDTHTLELRKASVLKACGAKVLQQACGFEVNGFWDPASGHFSNSAQSRENYELIREAARFIKFGSCKEKNISLAYKYGSDEFEPKHYSKKEVDKLLSETFVDSTGKSYSVGEIKGYLNRLTNVYPASDVNSSLKSYQDQDSTVMLELYFLKKFGLRQKSS